jgi:CRISPR-associated protein Cas1
MEPYRPFVDNLVVDIVNKNENISDITKDVKTELLQIPVIDVKINGQRSPLMIAVRQTTASLYKCFSGKTRKIKYPAFE